LLVGSVDPGVDRTDHHPGPIEASSPQARRAEGVDGPRSKRLAERSGNLRLDLGGPAVLLLRLPVGTDERDLRAGREGLEPRGGPLDDETIDDDDRLEIADGPGGLKTVELGPEAGLLPGRHPLERAEDGPPARPFVQSRAPEAPVERPQVQLIREV